jgi:ABC-2 type transport system ATP-binding protein
MTDEPTTPSGPEVEPGAPEGDEALSGALAAPDDDGPDTAEAAEAAEAADGDTAAPVATASRGVSPRGSRQSRRRGTAAGAATTTAGTGGREAPRQRRRLTVAEVLADVPEDAVIVTRRLTKQYGEFTAVERLDLTIRRGEVFGLLGPNGAGKTTTVLMLLGLTEPTKGVVRVLGLDPVREPLAVKRRVGYLPDNVGFYGPMTGRENLRYTAKLNGIARSQAESIIDELLHDVRLEDAADKRADTYSRGMRQRLGIADALVKQPSVLILDEPTIAIDPSGVEELLALLRRLVQERNLTVLLSSHILGQVQSLCDQVGFFSAGRLIAAGPLDELAGGENRITELEVAIDGPPSAIDPVVRQVPGVTDVRPDAKEERLRIVTATSDVAAPVAAALASAGLTLTHLRRRGTDLLELYRKYVPEGSDGRAR